MANKTVLAWDIPDTIREEAEKLGFPATKGFALRFSTPEDEAHAAQIAGGNASKGSVELLKRCLVEVDGKPVSIADDTAHEAFVSQFPPIRTFMMLCFGQVHNPREDVIKPFLTPKVRIVG
jgi:hypothetical protein